MLRVWRDGAWHGITWGGFARQAASAARTLRAAGVAPGDRVMIVSENRPEYPIVETALMAIRAVPVPAYTTNTVADHAHILRDSGARVAVVSTAALAGRVALAGPLDLLVTMEPFSYPGLTVAPWSALVADQRDPGDVAAEAAMIAPDALACLIYTSGTGGAPKGVMLPHRAILSNCRGAYRPAGQRCRRCRTRCICRSCRCRTATSTPPASSSCSAPAPRWSMRAGSRRSRPTC